MKSYRKNAIIAVTALAPLLAKAQAIPTDVSAAPGLGFQLPRVAGTLSYAVSASELISTGFYSARGASSTTNLSGDMGYVSRSARHPFSAVYTGGILLATSNQPTTAYQSLSVSQILNTKRWNIGVADSISYLPQSPTTGLSGIPGVGDLGVDPIAIGPASGIGILTTYGPRVSNTATGSVGRMLTAHISVQGSGDYSIQDFVGVNSAAALDSTNEGGSAGVSYHFSARSTLTGNYNYSRFAFTGDTFTFSTHGATLDYSRQWTRRLSTDVYAGPEIVTNSNPLVGGSSVEIAAGASANYVARQVSYALTYSRGVNNGSGVIPGSNSENLNLSAHRILARYWDFSGNLGYSRSRSLPGFALFTFTSQSVAASGQVTRRLGRFLSMFGSYTLEEQGVSTTSTTFNAFNGTSQILGFGITYSPANIPLGR